MKKILIVDDSDNWVKYHKFAAGELFGKEAAIETANSAKDGFSKVTANLDIPFNIILTDLQMESDFLPLYAGEWFIREIQMLKEYNNTRIIIISATNTIKKIAEKYKVEYLPKYMCKTLNTYDILKIST